MTTVTGSATVGGVAYQASASITLPSSPPPGGTCVLGIYDNADDWPSSWTGIQAFQNAGCPVKIGTYYVQWQGGWPANFANLCQQHGVIPFVEFEPWFTQTTWPAFTDIAAGKYDSWLQTIAQAVAAFGHPVWLTYAHEMNGSWYPWGNGGAEGVTPAQWIASWEHVTSVINAIAGSLVTWVWAPSNNDGGRAVTPYWPGDGSSVGLAAWDGYLNQAGQTFSSFLSPTLTEIRKLTSGPVWLAETGVEPAGSGRAARISGLVSDLHAAGVSGFNWFNQGVFALTPAEMTAFAAGVNAWNAS
jgi:mannan endo-1,4-beta-mannosidase